MAGFLYKKNSKIHDQGIFTKKDLIKGETFYKIPLTSISNKPQKGHAFIGNNRWVNDPNILNFINHSCDANTILDLTRNPPVLISNKDIPKDNEITCDYNKTEKGGNKIPCLCKSKNCRGYFIRIE